MHPPIAPASVRQLVDGPALGRLPPLPPLSSIGPLPMSLPRKAWTVVRLVVPALILAAAVIVLPSAPIASAADTVEYSTDCTGSQGATLGSPWVNVDGSVWKYDTNQCQHTGTSGGNKGSVFVGNASGPDQYVEFVHTYQSGTGAQSFAVLGANTLDGGTITDFYRGGYSRFSSAWQIGVTTAGVNTWIASVAASDPGTGGVLRFERIGSDLTLYLDAVVVATATNSDHSHSGLGWNTYHSNSIDDFSAGTTTGTGGTECSTLTYTFDLDTGSGFAPFVPSAGSVLYPGDVLRLNVDASGGLILEDLWLRTRWSAGHLWDHLGPTPYPGVSIGTPTAFPISFDETYSTSSPPISMAEYEIACDPVDPLGVTEYWTVAGGSSETAGVSECLSYSYAYATLDDPLLPLGPTTPISDLFDTVSAGDVVRITLDTSLTPPVSFAAFSFRASPSESFTPFATVSAPSVFPQDHDVPIVEDASYFSFEVACAGLDGQAWYSLPYGDASSTPAALGGDDQNGEGCYRTASMSLYKPWTWVTGAGRMGVCLVEYLVVPEPEVVDSYVSEAVTDLEGQFPFSAGFMAADFANDAVDSIATASPCFAIDIDVPGTSTPCLDSSVVTTSGSQRTVLVTLFIGMMVLSVLGASFALVSRDQS